MTYVVRSFEFEIGGSGRMLGTPCETTQPSRNDLEYGAGGLTPVYLEGALQRAMDAELAADDSLESPEDAASPVAPAAPGILDEPALIALIIAGVRARLAA